ncbi:MAG: VWA domain-containing protein, partial [Acetobacter sp.]|nr:VWA domain-containing protein [Acetobacter sp.]
MPFTSITFTPLIPLWLFILLASLAIAVSGISLVYSNKWTTLCRLGAFTVILLWLANPQQTHKTWRTLPPTALILVDNSPSMHFGERTALAQKALHFLENNHPPHLILHTVVVNDNGHEGTRLFSALQQASADIPPGHLAGVIMITDGENNDTPLSVPQQIPPQIITSNRYGQPFFLPLYVLLTASHEEIDRRLSVLQAPPYALVGKTAFIRIRVEDQGSLQKETPVTLTLRLNGAEPLTFPIHTGQSQEIHLPITHPGQNFIALSVSPLQGEVSTQNNQVIIPITGIRDRLRVLLISGSPNQEERSLRRFLKAD